MEDKPPSLWSRITIACRSVEEPDAPSDSSETLVELLPAALAGLITILVILSMSTFWIDHTLADGSVKQNARWAHLDDAYDHIAASTDSNVIIIGSSRMWSGIDGSCLDDRSIHPHVEHWNLAIRGDRPYLRLPETDELVRSHPDLVVMEAGPNSFSNGIGSIGDRLRWKVLSLDLTFDGTESWWHLLFPDDRQYLAVNAFERLSISQSFTPESGDELSRRLIFLGESRAMETGTDGMMPTPIGTETWVKALKDPPRLPDEKRPQGEQVLDEFLNYLHGHPFYSASDEQHLNRLAFEHILHALEENGTTVLLYAPPLHPLFLEQAEPGFWDGFNSTRSDFEMKGKTFIDRTFDIRPVNEFVDPVHFSASGREHICEDLGALIDTALLDVL